ncbi:hypothetical protein BCR33DRAFT_732860 [Rhizoclosmatium globosum]|uniref:Uncharacterized protein n=1 Tax=Rhizoclosmatium globosum TaxID=329046 RepID=A0A1Y2D1A8_9FUNG|nr:hypothetical protein BCR33DRAFT_732860 [Rhizoclosmatium globosum]|eukprot:ORY53068.1 hypothetical protein BCR33DRAFT_732860 [Rhizoclosmatium globosum]
MVARQAKAYLTHIGPKVTKNVIFTQRIREKAAHEHFVFVIDEHLTSQQSHCLSAGYEAGGVFHYMPVLTVRYQETLTFTAKNMDKDISLQSYWWLTCSFHLTALDTFLINNTKKFGTALLSLWLGYFFILAFGAGLAKTKAQKLKLSFTHSLNSYQHQERFRIILKLIPTFRWWADKVE